MTIKGSDRPAPLLLLIFLTALPQLSETIYSPALPAVAQTLHAPVAIVQWTLSIYFVGFAIGILAWGRAADRHGRRPAILAGMFCYSLASFGCYLTNSIEQLLVCRFIQAFGASTGSVIVQTILRDIYTPKLRARVFSLIVAVLAFAPGLGPLIGGYVTELSGWADNFLILTLMGMVAIILTALKLPETRVHTASNHHSIRKVGKRMMADRKVLTLSTLVGGFNGLLFSYYSEAPFIFITHFGLSSSQYGQLGFVLAAAIFSGAMVSRKAISVSDTVRFMRIGCLLSFIGAISLSLLIASGVFAHWYGLGAVFLYLLPLLFGFFGFSLVVPFALSQALDDYQQCLGTAGALLGFSYYVVVAILTFLMGALHNGRLITLPLYFTVLTFLMAITHRCYRCYELKVLLNKR